MRLLQKMLFVEELYTNEQKTFSAEVSDKKKRNKLIYTAEKQRNIICADQSHCHLLQSGASAISIGTVDMSAHLYTQVQ